MPPGWEQTKAATSLAWRLISSSARPGQPADDQGRGEGVAGADGVGHRDGPPRVVGPDPVGHEQAAAGPAGQCDHRQAEAAGQLRHRLPHAAGQAEHRGQLGQLLIVQLQGVGQGQRVGDHVAVDERGPEVHVEDAQRARTRAAETRERIASRDGSHR